MLTKQQKLNKGGEQDNPAGTGCPPSRQWMNEKWYAYPNELVAVANQAIFIQSLQISRVGGGGQAVQGAR